MSINEIKNSNSISLQTWFATPSPVVDGKPFNCSFCGSSHDTLRGLKIHTSRSSRCKKIAENNMSGPLSSLTDRLLYLKSHCKLVRRIPKASRHAVATEYSKLIDLVVCKNDVHSWEQLLLFPYRAFALPSKGKPKNTSLSSVIRNNLSSEVNFQEHQTDRYWKPPSLETRVELKLSEGDLSGAMRLLTSNDSFAKNNTETVNALRQKHPATQNDLSAVPPPESDIEPPQVTPAEVSKAIISFPHGSAGGIDGLRPQHLKDLTATTNGVAGETLLQSLVSLTNLMLAGSVPEEICPWLYGASLTALSKKDGGIRPIAVGNTLRRLTAKVACAKTSSVAGSLLRPFQLGFGTPGGIEAAVHSSRKYIKNSHGLRSMVKIDFVNAFNSVRRDWMLQEVRDKFPSLYPFLYQCYSKPSNLAFGSHIISSEVGVQQGDPLGPLIFCLAVNHIALSLKSELNIWYMDDITLMDIPEIVLSDMRVVEEEGRKIGLEINARKSEVFIFGESPNKQYTVYEEFNKMWPGICLLRDDVFLLGSPLTQQAVKRVLEIKLEEIHLLLERILTLQAHYALFIIKNSLAFPRLLFTIRTCPSWTEKHFLIEIDQAVRQGLEKTCNVLVDDTTWKQATLPTKYGGLGIHSVSELSVPAYMASVHSSECLMSSILPSSIAERPDPFLVEAETFWTQTLPAIDPIPCKSSQRSWTTVLNDQKRANLLDEAAEESTRIRLLAVGSRESSAWLEALPSPSLGTLMDNDSLRVAVGLRLGIPLCTPFPCRCGSIVDKYGLHCLSCADLGRRTRHGHLNETVRRALRSAGIPSCLEPPGLSRDDGKRPDGLSLTAWRGGKMLVWDVTCSHTLAASYVGLTSREAGAAANAAERRKRLKYSKLPSQYLFIPLGFETLGPWGEEASAFFKDLGSRIFSATREPRSASFLRQRLSMDIQRGNASCILSSLPSGAGLPMSQLP